MPLLRVMAGSRSFGALLAAFILAARVHALCAQFIRAEGHTTLYAVQGLLNTALYIALNVLFLTVFCWGVMGYLLSTVAADCLSALFLICRERLWRQLRPAPRAAPWRQMLAYCVPLIPTAVFWWIMGVSDRYLVKWFVGSDANGIYAVAYKIPTILTILATVFMDAWQLSAIAESGDRRAQARFYTRVWDAFFCRSRRSTAACIRRPRWRSARRCSTPRRWRRCGSTARTSHSGCTLWSLPLHTLRRSHSARLSRRRARATMW